MAAKSFIDESLYVYTTIENTFILAY